jgi:imidazolonepropionase-like amidohydrolase
MNPTRAFCHLLLFTMLTVSSVHGDTIVLVADRLIDGESGQASRDAVILVEGERILAVGDRDLIPDGAKVIELEGMTLMPGMINAHEHPQLFADDYQNAHLQSSSAYKTLRSLATLQTWLLAGWTSVRIMGDGDVYYGNLDIRRVIDEGHFIGPRLSGAAHYIGTTGGGGDVHFFSPEQDIIPDGLIADGPDEMIRAVRNEVKYGSDWIKILVTGAFLSVGSDPKNLAMSEAELEAVMSEARRLGVPVAAHAHATAGINAAIRAGARSIEHGTYLDDESIELMVEHGTYYVPTIYIGDHYAGSDKLLAQEKNDDPYLSYRDEWFRRIAKAHRAGVKIVTGLDLGSSPVDSPGVFAREFAVLVEAGLSEMDAIKAGTRVAADLLGRADLGRIAPGKLADIIAVPGNPLEDISALERVDFVMIGGRIVRQPGSSDGLAGLLAKPQ